MSSVSTTSCRGGQTAVDLAMAMGKSWRGTRATCRRPFRPRRSRARVFPQPVAALSKTTSTDGRSLDSEKDGRARLAALRFAAHGVDLIRDDDRAEAAALANDEPAPV